MTSKAKQKIVYKESESNYESYSSGTPMIQSPPEPTSESEKQTGREGQSKDAEASPFLLMMSNMIEIYMQNPTIQNQMNTHMKTILSDMSTKTLGSSIQREDNKENVDVQNSMEMKSSQEQSLDRLFLKRRKPVDSETKKEQDDSLDLKRKCQDFYDDVGFRSQAQPNSLGVKGRKKYRSQTQPLNELDMVPNMDTEKVASSEKMVFRLPRETSRASFNHQDNEIRSAVSKNSKQGRGKDFSFQGRNDDSSLEVSKGDIYDFNVKQIGPLSFASISKNPNKFFQSNFNSSDPTKGFDKTQKIKFPTSNKKANGKEPENRGKDNEGSLKKKPPIYKKNELLDQSSVNFSDMYLRRNSGNTFITSSSNQLTNGRTDYNYSYSITE